MGNATRAKEIGFAMSTRTEKISVTTLDSLVALEELTEISLLKVDVEGHLKAVLAGGQVTLATHRPIISAEFTGDDALDKLEQVHGYACKEVAPVHELRLCLPDPTAWPSVLSRLGSILRHTLN